MYHYQKNIGDYRSATMHLSLLEHGVYNQLLDWYYLDELPLSLDNRTLFRRLSAKSEIEQQAVLDVLQEMFTKTDEGWIHRRVEREIAQYRAKAEQARSAGKLGGRPSKKGVGYTENRDGFENKPDAKPTANQEPLTNNHIKESKDSLAASPSPAADESKPEKPQTGKRATALPEDFTLNETGRAYAKSKGVNADVELLSFRNWHGAKGSTMKDWQAAWRTWCDKAVVFGRVDGQARLTGPSDVVRITVSDGGAAAATKAMLDARERNTAPPPPEIRERMAALRQEIT